MASEAIPPQFAVSYANVQAILSDTALSQKRIVEYYVSAIHEMPFTQDENGVIACLFFSYLILEDSTSLRLDMKRSGNTPSTHSSSECPGVLQISAPPRGRSVEHIQGLSREQRALAFFSFKVPPAVVFTVKDCLELIRDRKLLRYTFLDQPSTHGCYWHWKVVYECALAGTLPGGSAHTLQIGYDDWNKSNIKSGWKIPADIHDRPGKFDA